MSNIFSGYIFSCTIACCGYLTFNKKLSIYTTRIKKVIVKLYSFTLRSKISDKQYYNRSDILQRSENSLDICLFIY